MAGFPSVPSDVDDSKDEFSKLLYTEQLTSTEADRAAERAVDTEFYKSLFAVAQGSIDRVRASADTVQKASAAIAALYTGLLGVAFSVKDHPLPSRGVIPMLFLGLAVAASTAYLAYQTHAKPVPILPPAGSIKERNVARATSLILWTRATADHWNYLLKVGVLALAAGLVFLPAPFISFKGSNAGLTSTTQTTTTTTADVAPAWPTPSSDITDVTLNKVVYTAQVAEAAELRKQARATPPANTGRNDIWWISAAAVALLVFAAPPIIDSITSTPRFSRTGSS